MTRFPLCAHLGYLFTEHALRDRFAAASRCGFRFVEHPAPYALAPDEASDLCKLNDLHMVQIATPMGDPGEKGLAAMVGREADFRASVDEAIVYARVLGTRYIHPMSGVQTQGASDAESWDVYIRNVAYSCDLAARAGLNVNVEPIGAGTLAGYFMNHPDKATRAIAAVARDNLFMTFDAFHAAQSNVDPAQFTREWGRVFRHVQIADDPGRHEPGSGTIDFPAFFEALATVGYAGVIGLEYVPAAGAAEGLAWADHYDRITPLEPSIDRESRT